MFRSEHSVKDFLVGVIIGGAIGATATVLLRTKMGKRIQNGLFAKYGELKKTLQPSASKRKKRAKVTPNRS